MQWNLYVKYKLNDENQTKVLSIQPKQTSFNWDWLNIHVDGQDEPFCIN